MMRRKNTAGGAMFVALGILAVLMMLSATLYAFLNQSIPYLGGMSRHQTCLNLAEAGIEKALAEMRVNGAGYNGETRTPLGQGFFSVEVRKNAGEGAGTEMVSTGFIEEAGRIEAQARLVARVTLTGGTVSRLAMREAEFQ